MKNFYLSVRNILSTGQIRLASAGMAAAFVMALLPGRLLAQAPAVSYTQTDNGAVTITPLSPVNTGGAVGSFGFSTPALVTTGVTDPVCMAMDKSGNLYIGESSGQVSLLPAGGTAATVFATGFGPVNSIVLDASNNVYLADGTKVWKIPAGSGTPVTLNSFSNPVSLAFNASGTLYVADENIPDSFGSIYSMAPDGSGKTVYALQVAPGALSFDSNGTLYYLSGSSVWSATPGGQSLVSNAFGNTSYLATDAGGNLYGAGGSGIYCNAAGIGVVTVAAVSAKGLMVDAHFNIYYADGHDIYKISPSGGYFITPQLSSGLAINSNTGVISGMRAGATAAVDYQITAFNASGSSTAAITIKPALPTLSYSSPQSYQPGSAITALSPSSARVATWGYSAGATVVSSGFGAPVDVAADAAGNVYIADFTQNQVEQIPAGGGAPVVFSSGFSQPFGVAVDAAGNLYVADAGNNAVKEIVAGSGTVNTIGSGFSGPTAVAVDGSGNVYVGDNGNSALKEIPAGGGTPVTLQSGFASIQGVAVDAAGNVYVADAGVGTSGNGAVYKVQPGGGSMVSVGTGFSRPSGIAADAAGNLYVTDVDKSVINIIEQGGTQITVGSGFNHANGVTFDSGGNLYIADSGTGLVKEVKITGGYFLSPLLPVGLTFNNNTGVISGTPSAPSPKANYTVSCWNVAGSASIAVSITVGAPVISYNSPVAYAIGLAITPLTPFSTGTAVPGRSYATPVDVASGITDATCIAIDKAGNMYIGQASGQVSKLVPGSSTAAVYATGFATIDPAATRQGIAIDTSGNLFFADGVSLWKIPAGGGTPVTLGSFSQPTAVAVDNAGNIYVTDLDQGLCKIAGDGSGQSTIVPGGIEAVTVDGSGNLFFLSGVLVYEIPQGGTYKQLGNASTAIDMACDQTGNVYVLCFSGPAFKLFPKGGGSGVMLGPRVILPAASGLVVDVNFNIYTASGTITRYSPNGGYFTNPELPDGLSINGNTGAISGIPAVASRATNYAIEAFNAAGNTTATVNMIVGPAPVISYSTPQIFTAGTAITPLQPSATGAVVGTPGFSTTTFTLSTGITNATCTAMDKNGNLYIGESSGKVSVLAPGSTTATVLATGFGTGIPHGGIAVDASGNVYVADQLFLWKIPAGGGTPVKVSGILEAAQVSIDGAGNVYVRILDQGIYKMASDGSNITQIYSGLPSAMAVDQNGNVFFSGRGSQAKTFEIPAGGVQKTVNPNGSRIYTTDPSGNIYMVNSDGSIGMIPAGGTIESQVEPAPATFGITSIMVGPNFNLYTVLNGSIIKAGPAGGYFISPELPVGLTMDPTTGAISGTPTAVSPASDYTVTAFSGSVGSTATVNITVNPSAPTISYATPQVYAQNTAIIPLSPTASNVAAPGYFSTATTAGSFAQPFATAVDQSGNVYVADKSANSIYELPAGGGQVTVGTGLNTPAAVAVDKAGNVYTANQGDNTVVEIQAHTGTQTFVGSGYQRPTAVAVDSAGNVFIADVQGAAGVVYKIRPGQNKVLFKSGFINPNGIAVDAAGNVYVSDFGGGPTASMVYEISPDGSAETPVNHSFSTATGVAIDATGNLFIVDAGNMNVIEYPAGGGSAITLTAGLTFPFGLSADGAGNLYVADPGAGKVVKLAPAGGYFINRALPSGLALNAATGAISGTPTAAAPATTYTVSAYNATGGGAAAVNIKVISANVNLSSLKMSKGIFSPAFTNTTTSYTDAVGNTITSVTVTPTALDPDATIQVNGTTVPSCTASGPVTLNVGPNAIYVAITSSDGTATKTDTVTVNRAPSASDKLISLKMSNGIFGPAFSPTNFSYTDAIGNTISTVTVTATTADPTATITVNGATVTSGTASPVNVPFGSSAINVKVTAQDGSTSQTYSITVTRPADSNADLFSLRVSMGRFSWPFDRNVLSYADTVSNDKTMIKLTPTTLDNGARVTVNGTPVISGTASGPVSLVLGNNPIAVIVTAEDGTTKTYTVNVLRPAFTSDNLAALKVSKGIFGPAFESSNLNYTDNVGNGISSITVTPTAGNPTATIKVNGLPVVSGAESAPVNLAAGSTTISITVKAQDSITTKTYTITVNRPAGSADSYDQGISVTRPFGAGVQNFEPLTLDDGIQVHQGVSPNGDGINDFLQIDNISQYPDNKLTIMNRNGQLVYEASGYDNSSRVFDGHSNKNGQMQLPGTYFYQLDYTVNGITKHKTGFLLLKY